MIKLNLRDIIALGSISQAIIHMCRDGWEFSSGVVGPSFSTSGPGSGWSIQYDSSEFAKRALREEGAIGYIDCDDGRLAELDDEGNVVWSADSVVVITGHNDLDLILDKNNLEILKKVKDAVDSGYLVCENYKNYILDDVVQLFEEGNSVNKIVMTLLEKEYIDTWKASRHIFGKLEITEDDHEPEAFDWGDYPLWVISDHALLSDGEVLYSWTRCSVGSYDENGDWTVDEDTSGGDYIPEDIRRLLWHLGMEDFIPTVNEPKMEETA